jgi:16S rRNA (cytosine1402-N4)-methyltransferase
MGRVDGVLIDAGMSSIQLDDAARGFTFQAAGPLDMRMDPSAGITAADYLAKISESDLANVLHEYGEVQRSRRVAKAICARRDEGTLRTTRDLVDAALGSLGILPEAQRSTGILPVAQRGTGILPVSPLRGHRADLVRQVFQAIRIAVNDELGSLERGLRGAVNILAPGGRLVLIAFQSGEDRVWKRVMHDVARKREELTPDGRVERVIPPVMRVLTKRPVPPSKEEIAANPRAHSARLRAAEKR